MNAASGQDDASANVEAHIRQATDHAGKAYAFDEKHSDDKPIDWWFQQSHEGLVLFTVFYTQACRWSLCTGCNLPSVSSCRHVGWRSIIRQIDAILANQKVQAKKEEIAKVIVSNNGSVLDEETFSSTALMYLVTQLNLQLPRMKTLSIETRPEYVDVAELEFLARAIRERDEPAQIELAIGFEAFDDDVRNQTFLKGLTLHTFEELVRKISQPQFRLKCYFMQKPVAEMDDEAAVRDIQAGVDYLSDIAARHGVPINMHLNPTFVARGTPLETSFRSGAYVPPRLCDVARAAHHGAGKPLSIFIGLSDEGLAVPGGSFLTPGSKPLVQNLETFNRTQDYEALAQTINTHCDAPTGGLNHQC